MDVQPLNQNLDSVFASITFYIDFYQRDYKWTNEPVNRLLDDVFYKFNQEYESNKELDVNEDIITSNYSWYYLNTYVTNKVGGKTYVVDGQQRLTTLTLMLIKLRHLTKVYKSELSGWIEAKIAGKSGFKNNYWMYHENHIKCLEELFDGEKDLKEVDTSSGITAVNMVKNYDVISKYLDKEIKTKHKFETFTFYFLHRLVLINLTVEQTDVPMVFEVINDRGVRLKPFEILKGKLLGQIDKQELETGKYNELWETQINAINDHFEDEADEFFRYYLKAKFANNRKEGHVFDGDYHREMFSNGMKDKLKLKHNPSGVKEFLKNSFKYYSDLYLKILGFYRNLKEEQPYIYFNYLNERAGQFMLILSACQLNDLNEDEKIKAISYEVDRAFALLQLQNCYDSNAFTEMEYKVSSEIRGKDMSEYRAVFDKFLMEQIGASRSAEVVKPIQYSYFKTTGMNLNLRFKRYFFARIEKFLAENMNLSLKHPFGDLVTKTGPKTGFHIEHILAYNDENLEYFEDEETFERERNRLGGILLLKGRDNISSSNESFKDKLRSYDNTLYWNETLREDFYKSKKDVDDLIKKLKLYLKPYQKFGQEELDARHKLLFEMINQIWR